jgi:hypothetical protein
MLAESSKNFRKNTQKGELRVSSPNASGQFDCNPTNLLKIEVRRFEC